MDVLVDIVAGYFHKLGRVIRVHMDSYGSHTTMEVCKCHYRLREWWADTLK